MEFESPDVEKEFPGLYASDPTRQNQDRESDLSDGAHHDKHSRKELLIGRKRDKRESKKDKGYVAFEGESSQEEIMDSEQKSPSKGKKAKSAFKFSKRDKSKDKEKGKEKEKEKDAKDDKKERKESKEEKRDKKEVKDEKKEKKESRVKIKLRDKKKSKHPEDEAEREDKLLFGVPLHVAVERNRCHDGIELPAIVRECIDYIEEHGLACEGIYRLSGVKSKVQKLKTQYNCGAQVYLYEHEPHIVASLLKLFLRELPEPVLTEALMPQFEETSALKDEEKRGEMLKKLIDELPMCNRLLLSWIFVHMTHIIQREKQNKMNVQNVSIVLSPTMQISHRVLNVLFIHSRRLFGDTVLKKYVPPLNPENARLSLELPDSPTAIEEELQKQESRLNQLHAEMNAGFVNPEREELLWEVQRVVTQLKRKLRFAKREREVKSEENIDTRLQNDHEESAKVTQVESDHKCKVYVPWENDKDNNSEVPKPCMVNDRHSLTVSPNNLNEQNVSRLENGNNKFNSDIEENEQSISTIEVVPDAERTLFCTTDFEDRNEEHNYSDDAELQQLIREKQFVDVEHDELVQLGGELKRKIETERCEVERLKTKIQELQHLYCYRRLSRGNSSENSSDVIDTDSEEEEYPDLDDEEEFIQEIVDDLIKKNTALEIQNSELIAKIQQEREACLDVKVQIRIIQQHHEVPVSDSLNES